MYGVNAEKSLNDTIRHAKTSSERWWWFSYRRRNFSLSGALIRMLVNITIICVVFVSIHCVVTRVQCDVNLFRSLTGSFLLFVYEYYIYYWVRIGSQLEYYLLHWLLYELHYEAHATATIGCSSESRNFNFSLVSRLTIHIRNVPFACEITSKCIYQSQNEME